MSVHRLTTLARGVRAGERGQRARQALAALNVDMKDSITVENAEHRRKVRQGPSHPAVHLRMQVARICFVSSHPLLFMLSLTRLNTTCQGLACKMQARLAHPDIVRRPDEAEGLDWEAIIADDHILLSAVYLARDWTKEQPGKHAVVQPLTFPNRLAPGAPPPRGHSAAVHWVVCSN